ncbi:MAG: aspartyl/asparaginyl beta-hydroxylase domain-containing protein [Sphingosinicella sp.]
MSETAQSLIEAGVAAAREGHPQIALAQFEQAAADGGRPPWILLAQAWNKAGDAAAEEAALQRQLELNKRDLPALLAMGELKRRLDDTRSAAAFFRTALTQAAADGRVPTQLHPLLERAQAFLADAHRKYEAHLLDELQAAGIDEGSASPRMRQALAILLGRQPVYLQQPNMFYFPGLPQRPFYEREEFGWLAAIEAEYPAMRDELMGVVAEEAEFAPYVTGSPNRPLPNNPLLNDPSWGAFYLWEGGTPVADHAKRCPSVMLALENAPMPVIRNRSPMALFSLLKPGTHIAPHHGMLNTRLICHVPLIAPPGCELRVGPETRPWQEGHTLIFDDSFEHEAWNRSERTRIILLFEIWRPEIGEQERAELVTLFEAIDLQPQGEAVDAH